MTRRFMFVLFVCILAAAGVRAQDAPKPAAVPDVTGTWKASFETQIGVQNYTYELAVKDGVVTGTATSDNGKSDLKDGKVEGDAITFTELLTFMDMQIPIAYTGKIVSADEIAFTREVGEFATEQLVAKRAK